jgi:hypothetical protein
MLIRRAEYSSTDGGVNKSKNSKQRIQVAMLDVATGQLRANHLIKETTVGREPRLQIICRPGKEYQDTPEAPANQKDDDPSHTDSQRLELLISSKRYRVQLADSTEETDSKAPAILTNDSSTVKIDDRTNKVAENKDSDLVVDLEPVAQKAKEAYQAMLELGKVEAELFEKQRKQEQRQR